MSSNKARMIKRVLVGLVVLMVIGVVVTVFWGGPPNRNELKARRVTDAVLNLPVGSSRARVTAFLDSEGIGYSYVGDEDDINITSAVADNGYSWEDLSGYIVAIIRNTSSRLLVSGDVQYFFFFDKSGNLLKATAKEVFTGP